MADDGEVCGACLHRLDSHTPDSSASGMLTESSVRIRDSYSRTQDSGWSPQKSCPARPGSPECPDFFLPGISGPGNGARS